jgi:integrase
MATIWKDMRTRGRPTWCILYKGLDARWHRERTEAQSKEQAQRVLRSRLSEIAEAKEKGLLTLERRKPVTFEKFVDEEYMTAQAPPARRHSTHERDQQLYKNVKATFGPVLLGAITTADIEKYFAKRKNGVTCRGTPPSKAQMNRERQFLGSVLGMAKRWGLIDRNFVEDVKKLREDNAQDRVLSPDEEKEVLKKSPTFLVPIIHVAINTGMRLGEILGLKWSEIDRKDGEAVQGGFIRIGSESKGHRARHVPINGAAKTALDAQKPVETEKGFVPFVFVSPRTTKAYKVTSISLAFASTARRANVEGVSFHTLRHTAVSRMVAAGIPDRIIMKIVGHTTPNMVSRYAHLAPNNLKGATDCLDGGNRTPVVQNTSPRVAGKGRS